MCGEIVSSTIRDSLMSLYGVSTSTGFLCSYFITIDFIKINDKMVVVIMMTTTMMMMMMMMMMMIIIIIIIIILIYIMCG